MIIEKKLEEMGLTLPEYPEGQGVFDHVKEFGPNLAYVAGCGPEINGVLHWPCRQRSYHGASKGVCCGLYAKLSSCFTIAFRRFGSHQTVCKNDGLRCL